MRFVICMYNKEKKLKGSSMFSCWSCVLKLAMKQSGACCIRQNDSKGRIVWSNAKFKELFK